MIYRKLKRVSMYGYSRDVPGFRETFPELSNLDDEELATRWNKLDIVFYTEERKKVSIWRRLTLPFALLTMLVMLIGIPVNYIVTSQWGYSLGEKNRIYNWFKSLGLQ